MSSRARLAAGAVFLAVFGLLAAVTVNAAPAPELWRLQNLGEGGGEWAWSPGGAAWRIYADDIEETSGSVVTWDASTETTSLLCVTRVTDWDSGLAWYRGRVYWLRAPASGPDKRFEILSVAPGESAPAVVLRREGTAQGQFEMVGDRMIWSEWLPGKREWAVYTMRLSDRKPELVQQFLGTEEDDFDSADVRLGSRALAWAELGSDEAVGMKTVYALPIDESGNLQAKVKLDAGGAYLLDTLRVDGNRLVWVALDGDRERVYTWKVGESRPQPVPDSALLERDNPLIETAVSADRLAWSSGIYPDRGGGRCAVRTWAAGQSVATTLAVYPISPNGDMVSAPSVSGNRIVWVVARAEGYRDDADSNVFPPPDGAIVTWSVGDDRPQVIVKHLPIWASSAVLRVNGDRIAFLGEPEDVLHETVYLVRPQTEATAAAAVNADVATMPPASVETHEEGPEARVLVIVVGMAAVAALAAFFAWRVVVRRRRRSSSKGSGPV
jgi:hypothetical protein